MHTRARIVTATAQFPPGPSQQRDVPGVADWLDHPSTAWHRGAAWTTRTPLRHSRTTRWVASVTASPRHAALVGFERTREIVLRHLTAIRNDMVVGGGLVAVSLVGVLAAAALSVCDLRRAARLQLSSPGWTTSVRVPALHRGSSSHLRLGARGVET
jgi:hypothetical protein